MSERCERVKGSGVISEGGVGYMYIQLLKVEVKAPLPPIPSPYVVKYYGSYFKNTDLWVS